MIRRNAGRSLSSNGVGATGNIGNKVNREHR
jgi:hypothetical protein